MACGAAKCTQQPEDDYNGWTGAQAVTAQVTTAKRHTNRSARVVSLKHGRLPVSSVSVFITVSSVFPTGFQPVVIPSPFRRFQFPIAPTVPQPISIPFRPGIGQIMRRASIGRVRSRADLALCAPAGPAAAVPLRVSSAVITLTPETEAETFGLDHQAQPAGDGGFR